METVLNVIRKALDEGRTTLSEHESMEILRSYGVPVTREVEVSQPAQLAAALKEIGYPLVMKASSAEILHKTEAGLVRLDVRNEKEAYAAFQDILTRMEGKEKVVLVQEMVQSRRELMAGMIRDPQFGPSAMFGLGGIFAEILQDVSFRVAPLETEDAMEMMGEIRASRILGGVRGLPPADVEKLSEILVSLGRIGLDNPWIQEIDINPIVLAGKDPVAVDALVVLKKSD